MNDHFLNALHGSFQRHRGRCALLYRGQAWTYSQLYAAALRCAAEIQRVGVQPGDRLAFVTPAKLPFLIGHLAALFAGAVVVPLNPRFTREELRYFLTDCGARLIMAGKEQQTLVEQIIRELAQTPVVMPDSVCLEAPESRYRETSLVSDAACLMLYSSGTTGWPKGVVHTHAGVAQGLAALAECWQMTEDDVVVNVLPLFHIHGLAFATHLTWFSGGTLLVDDAFDVERTMAALPRSTVFMAVPSMYYRLLDHPAFQESAKQWNHLRLFTCGSAPIRAEVLPKLESILRRPVINRYGMTEAYVISSLPLDGPWPHGSVGVPLPGIELQLVLENGARAALGEVGSVQIRGPQLFREYWNKPQETRDARPNGWFDTGDLGQCDAAGYLTLVGRKHDLIIVDGYNVYPQVIERVLGACPGVGECAVLSVPDAKRGERVAAAVVRNDRQLDEAAIVAWCSERLVYYQQPRSIVFVESLPRNSLGKVLRRELVGLFH